MDLRRQCRGWPGECVTDAVQRSLFANDRSRKAQVIALIVSRWLSGELHLEPPPLSSGMIAALAAELRRAVH